MCRSTRPIRISLPLSCRRGRRLIRIRLGHNQNILSGSCKPCSTSLRTICNDLLRVKSFNSVMGCRNLFRTAHDSSNSSGKNGGSKRCATPPSPLRQIPGTRHSADQEKHKPVENLLPKRRVGIRWKLANINTKDSLTFSFVPSQSHNAFELRIVSQIRIKSRLVHSGNGVSRCIGQRSNSLDVFEGSRVTSLDPCSISLSTIVTCCCNCMLASFNSGQKTDQTVIPAKLLSHCLPGQTEILGAQTLHLDRDLDPLRLNGDNEIGLAEIQASNYNL